MKNKFSLPRLIISIAVPLFVGALSGLLSQGAMQNADYIQPALTPPPILFPIVWTILFILIGISAYLVSSKDSHEKHKALAVYAAQLFFNFIWPLLFFNRQAYLVSLLWLAALWLLVLYMIKLFYPISKAAALLQIPYILWLTFAFYLNLSVFLLNR